MTLTKVILPEKQDDFNGFCEGIWVTVLVGDENEGVGMLSNSPLADYVELGDLVAYTDGGVAFTKPRVVAYKNIGLSKEAYFRESESQSLKMQRLASSFHEFASDQIIAARRIIKPWAICAKCGKIPEMFMVSNEEWRSVVPKAFRDKVLCRECYDSLSAENPSPEGFAQAVYNRSGPTLKSLGFADVLKDQLEKLELELEPVLLQMFVQGFETSWKNIEDLGSRAAPDDLGWLQRAVRDKLVQDGATRITAEIMSRAYVAGYMQGVVELANQKMAIYRRRGIVP